jgi:hypothetical protein
MFGRAKLALTNFHKSHQYPVAVVATLGLVGFLLDYFWKPVSTAGLILLGLAVSPWLLKVIKVKKGTVAGWEFELAQPSAPAETGERLAEEIRNDEADPPEQIAPEIIENATPNEGDAHPQDAPVTNVPSPSGTFRSELVAQAYLAEGLVFQELQREFGGTVQREVRVGPYAVDGIVFGPSGPVAVEVKLVSPKSVGRARLIDAGARLLQLSSLGGEKYGNLRPLLAIVVRDDDGPSEHWRRRIREFRTEFSRIDTRVFKLEELLQKYGITEE